MAELSIVGYEPPSVRSMIDEAADRYGVPRSLAHTVATMESGYDQSRRSPKGAIGVMQLMPATARQMGVNPLDTAENIQGGMQYLAQLWKESKGNPDLTMAAYNAGPAAVKQYGGIPPFPETQDYVKRGTKLLAQAQPPAAPTSAGGLSIVGYEPLPSAPGKYPMPEPPGAPKIAALQPDKPRQPFLQVAKREYPRLAGIAMESSGQKLATDLLGGGSKAVMDFITGSPSDPRNTERFLQAGKGLVGFVRDEPHRMADQLQKSGAAMMRGDINAAADHLWFSIPFAGAAGQVMKDYLDKGDVSGAFTHALGTLAPIAGKPVVETVKRGGGQIVSDIKATPAAVGIRAAAPDVAAGTAKMGAGYLMEHFVPGAGYLKYAVELPTAYSGAKQIRQGFRKGVAARHQLLRDRATAAAEALAKERADAQAAAQPVVIPEERRLNAPAPPPDTSYVRAVPAEPLPPSRQLAAPGRPAIITPAPDPLAGDASGVRSVPAVYGSPAVNEAATGMREAMGLQPGELAPSAPRTAPATARASQIDQMARHMRQSGITAAEAGLLDPPELAALANAAGIEGPLGKVAVRVRKRLAAMEKAEAETAKYQAAWDKLKPAEKAAVTGEAEAPAVERKPPASETAIPATAEQANVELGKSLSVEMPAEKPPALTASQKRVQGMAAILAEGEIPVEQLRGGLKTDVRARLFLESESQRLGYGKIAAGELDKIIAEIERLRSEAPISKAK